MTVYLVGAGPGDPGLLTVRAAELLATAEVLVHDRLTPAELRALAPADAEVVDVGKHPGGPADAQTRINELLVELGRSGRRVVRLKGGDPFVFARGAEEALALAQAGVDFEVVPGVTSAVAAPSSAGIPVTLRGHSAWVTVVTGHEDPAKGEPEVDWEAMGALGGTLVVLMGVKRWPEISARLVAGGRDPSTPAAAVRWGSRPEQQTVRGTLTSLDLADLGPPATVVVGEVAAVDLNWFESRPLFGRTVVVTRTAEQAGELSDRLRRLGARVLGVPTISVTDPDDGGTALRSAVARAGEYEWVVLTSPNGARRFCAALRDGRDLAGVRLAAIGPGTAQVLAEHHLVCDLVPERFVAEGLLEAFPPPSGRRKVLLARAEVARDALPEGLVAAGWQVDVVPAYRTRPAVVDAESAEQVAAADAITFTSSSTVTNFVATGAPVPPVVVAIGPVTAATARAAGLDVTVEADPHTLDGLVDALVAHVSA
ncbi:MAG: uroporphyrinogen-III C-methyltransferase [Actinomycetes bacterium]